jgi:hypothetical protein
MRLIDDNAESSGIRVRMQTFAWCRPPTLAAFDDANSDLYEAPRSGPGQELMSILTTMSGGCAVHRSRNTAVPRKRSRVGPSCVTQNPPRRNPTIRRFLGESTHKAVVPKRETPARWEGDILCNLQPTHSMVDWSILQTNSCRTSL